MISIETKDDSTRYKVEEEIDIEIMNKTFYVQIKKKKLLTNLRLNDIYPKQRLISEFETIIEELKKQPDDVFLIDFISSPSFCLTITSFKGLDKMLSSATTGPV
jgi:hypothetical protein